MNETKFEQANRDLYLDRSNIAGTGVFAARDFMPGETMGYWEGHIIKEDTRYSLTLDGTRIEPTGVLRWLNHSCGPSAYFNGRWIIAIRKLRKETEITVDYLATERTLSHHFECNCGSCECKGWI
jgi:hypothetical protein